ncbi:MAG TPA: DUF1499 domain-containing protein [Thermoanaerobaculia bacterium]|nr:DUF1499 domain-containing protein [Thermoanaerobaculia bacterium]
MKISYLPLALAVAALLLLPLSGAGVRFGLWPFRFGFKVLAAAAGVGVLAAVCGLVGLAVPRLRAGSLGILAVAVVVGLAVAYVPWNTGRQAKKAPWIHDISTDLSDPPSFVAILPLRAGAPNPATYGGPEVAAAQRAAYPDVQPLQLDTPPAAAFARALAAARAMGWDVVAADPAAGRIEATATTLWFGFKDDVVVRVKPAGTGSRVDVRSVSRVGKSDVGTNAKRIRAYLAKVAAGG